MVRSDGAILEIGSLSSQIVGAFLNQAVKKSGRTTGLPPPRSKIIGLNATLRVAYETECAGGTAFTKTYTGQIVLSNMAASSSTVETPARCCSKTCPSTARGGLLYAGSATTAIANPIAEVLQYVGGMLVVSPAWVGN